jgi:cation-transporting ATPase 13A3/4/5
MGLVQTCIILASAFIRVFLRLRAETRIKEMSEHISEVNILRDGKWISNACTGDLVPGDVFQIEENTTIPCDAVLLSGTVVVNESALTGEAMPIRKFPISNDDTPYEKNGSSKVNTLFSGTLVSQVTPSTDDRVFALVLHTGIASEKGMLIQKILFPAPVSFIFNEHIKIAISILLVWGLVAFALSLYMMGRGNITSWFYGVFVISEIFSPLLPAAFTINQSVCAARLRTKQILCIDLPRINLSGKVRIFCFDKTGTLTKEGLEFYGGVVTEGEKKTFTPCEEEPLQLESNLATGIATCHAVTKLKDQFIGNPVDIESFRAMKWDLLPPADPQYLDTLKAPSASPNEKERLVHVIRRFEFVHARASQSVAVLDEQTQRVHIYLKGSFERVKYLSAPESIPDQYDEEAAKYAQEGCYVLAMSHRDLGVLGEDITMEQVKTMTRDELEQDCQFAGFILFRNKLKHDTTDAIAQLKGGDTRVVMITGDTALTGIFIARECGMISSSQRVLLGDFVSGNMVWRDVDSGESVDVDEVIEQDLHEPHEKNIELALTGRGFEALIAQDQIRKYLLMTRVFARMTPNDKVMCVQLHMEKGVTAMCGDGGNDCGALRAAHVGLALSEAEASIVSPFSTNNRSVMQCVELLRQGRSALATSFANYKFLILYGESMAFWELIMFYFTVIAPQNIWITIDGFITTFMTVAITQARPADKLSPCRPSAKPLGAYTLASLLGIIFINFWFICCRYIYNGLIITIIPAFSNIHTIYIVLYGFSSRTGLFVMNLMVLLLTQPNGG